MKPQRKENTVRNEKYNSTSRAIIRVTNSFWMTWTEQWRT